MLPTNPCLITGLVRDNSAEPIDAISSDLERMGFNLRVP